ncbi:anion permease [Serratia ureilytica]
MGMSWVGGTILLTLIYLYSHYFFASTTAHVTAMFAAFFARGIALGAPPALLGLILAFSSSLMMSLTHCGTGTAPIVFRLRLRDAGGMVEAGWVMSVVNLLVWIVIGGHGGSCWATGDTRHTWKLPLCWLRKCTPVTVH